MGTSDLVLAAVIIAAAAALLARAFRRTQGGCHGCSGAACGARPRPPDLVKLARR